MEVKVLIIQQKMIGDVLTSSFLVPEIKKIMNNARVDYLVNKNTASVLENNPYINNVILYPKDKGFRGFIEMYKLVRKGNYTHVIDVYSKIGSAIISALTKAPIKVGYKKWYTSFIYTDVVVPNKKAKTIAGLAIENRKKLLKILGADAIINFKPTIYLTNDEKRRAKETLDKAGIDQSNNIYMISVLGSGENKTYPLEYMAKLLDEIVEQDKKCTLLLNYIPSQLEFVNRIIDSCNHKTQINIRKDVYGKSLREFLILASCCTAVIGNEGGAINMGKALRIPTFSIYSPWIKKEVWALFEDDKEHVSVHLKDFKPDFFHDKTTQLLKDDNADLYKEFTPDLILEKMKQFLRSFTNISK